MGYCSDIFIKAKLEVFPQLLQVMKETELAREADFSSDDEYCYLSLYSLKWYDSYNDVQKVNIFINSCAEDGTATMIRDGEEAEDVETYGADPWDLDLEYYIEIRLEGFDHSEGSCDSLKTTFPELFV
jgi:hypothetical protein